MLLTDERQIQSAVRETRCIQVVKSEEIDVRMSSLERNGMVYYGASYEVISTGRQLQPPTRASKAPFASRHKWQAGCRRRYQTTGVQYLPAALLPARTPIRVSSGHLSFPDGKVTRAWESMPVAPPLVSARSSSPLKATSGCKWFLGVIQVASKICHPDITTCKFEHHEMAGGVNLPHFKSSTKPTDILTPRCILTRRMYRIAWSFDSNL